MTLEEASAGPIASDPARDILTLASGLSIGKRLPDAVYVHVDGLCECPAALQELVARAREQAAVPPDAFNVVKFGTLAPRLSLLCYERFDEDPFPPLARAWTIDLRSLKVAERRYDLSGNPPILHRKETLLGATDRRTARWAALTQELDKLGLYADAEKIGWRRAWSARLRERGYSVEDHALVRLESPPKPTTELVAVERHRTAIERNVLSTPVQHLWRHGFLDAQRTFFDYGCGRGGDLRALRAAGIDARGWDPHYASVGLGDGILRRSTPVRPAGETRWPGGAGVSARWPSVHTRRVQSAHRRSCCRRERSSSSGLWSARGRASSRQTRRCRR